MPPAELMMGPMLPKMLERRPVIWAGLKDWGVGRGMARARGWRRMRGRRRWVGCIVFVCVVVVVVLD